MDPFTVVVLIVAAAVGVAIGLVVAGARHKRGLRAAVIAAEERARTQLLLCQDHSVVKDDRHRVTELLVNLPETVNMMGAARSTSALCRITVRAVMDLVEARRVGLFLARGTPPRFQLEVFAGRPRPPDDLCFDIGEGRLGQLSELIGVRTGGDLSVTAAAATAADDAFGPDLCVAVRRHGTVHAFVVVDEPKMRDAMTRRVLQMISDLHAVSAEGLKLLHKERARAELDKLTGLFNRHHLDRRLEEEVARAQAYDLKLSLFLFDIDHFKNYNDTNGHQAGDDCLKWVAAVSRKVTRGSDVICRYGGEEFLIIHLGSGRDEAWHHAERVRKAIAGTQFPGGPTQPLGRVSVSGGVASFPEDASDPVQLIALADRALYAAKESGRDKVLRVTDLEDPSQAAPQPSMSAPQPAVGSPPARVRQPQPARPPASPQVQAQLRATDPVMTPLPVPLPVAEEAPRSRVRQGGDVRRSDPAIMPLAARYATARSAVAGGAPGDVRATDPVMTPLPQRPGRLPHNPAIRALHSSLPPDQLEALPDEDERPSSGTYFIHDDPKGRDRFR